METLKKIGLAVLAFLGAALAFLSLRDKQTHKILKENEQAKGKVEELGETINEKLEEVKIEEKKIKNLEKQKKEVENESNTDDNIDFINGKY